MKNSRNSAGFTLIEMILVIMIMSGILVLLGNYTTTRTNQLRRDRAAAQMQQILNAGLNYYVSNGAWPVTCGTPKSLSTASNTLLQTTGYLPTSAMPTPFPGASYTINCSTTNNLFSVVLSPLTNLADATVLVGELPIATVSATAPYSVTSQVQVPGQNLNNARSVNMAQLYRHGACVPQPTCPSGMKPQILVTPAQINGVFDQPTTDSAGKNLCTTTSFTSSGGGTIGSSSTNCKYINYYSIVGANAYATGPTAISSLGGNGPPACDNSGNTEPCYQNTSGCTGTASNCPASSWTAVPIGNYWRVCLFIITEKGYIKVPEFTTANASNQNMYWTESLGNILAVTRCVPTGEQSGSDLTVYGY